MAPIQLRFLYLFCSTFCITLACLEDELYVIRNLDSKGLVLDGKNTSAVTIEYFNGFSPQLWKFERASRPGLYFIVNNHTGTVLDFFESDMLYLVTNHRSNVLRQQWAVALNGRIVNAENRKNVDIWGAVYTPGHRMIVWEDNQMLAQEFVLEQKS